VKNDFDLNTFVEGFVQMQQATVARELVHLRSDLSSVLKQHHGENRPAQLYAG
jgi:hypothetical protein